MMPEEWMRLLIFIVGAVVVIASDKPETRDLGMLLVLVALVSQGYHKIHEDLDAICAAVECGSTATGGTQ